MKGDPDEIEIEDASDEENDINVAINYDIATYPSDFTLSGIAQMWDDGDILIPDFQREFVWTIQQSSLLVDSFLCGLPVPAVFFYIDENNKNLVIDGQQRILSIVFFMEGFFGKESTHGKRQVFRLQGLDPKSPYFNKKFSELEDADQRKFKQAVLRAVNIRQLGPVGENTSVYHIFERLNTGGTPLTPQEIRNCVFRGPINKMLKEANTDKNWRKIIGKVVLDKHQKDVEILLRVFSLVGNTTSYEKPMKEFLNKAMSKHDAGETGKSKKFFKMFPEVTKFIIEGLGEKPFHIRGPLNTSVLDAVLCTIFDRFHKLEYPDFKKNFKALIKDDKFLNLTQRGTTDTKTLRDRMQIAKEYLLGD